METSLLKESTSKRSESLSTLGTCMQPLLNIISILATLTLVVCSIVYGGMRYHDNTERPAKGDVLFAGMCACTTMAISESFRRYLS